MLNIIGRTWVARVADPLGAWLVRRGVRANALTVTGTVATSAAALWFFPRGELLVGAVVVTLFVLFDLLDGAVARAQGPSTPFGEVLDSTCDRMADAAVFGALAWWCFTEAQHHVLAVAALLCLVLAQVISYIKARAQSAGLCGDGGLMERPERLIVTLVGAGLAGMGVPYAIDVALWAVAGLSLITVVQRLGAVRRSARDTSAS